MFRAEERLYSLFICHFIDIPKNKFLMNLSNGGTDVKRILSFSMLFYIECTYSRLYPLPNFVSRKWKIKLLQSSQYIWIMLPNAKNYLLRKLVDIPKSLNKFLKRNEIHVSSDSTFFLYVILHRLHVLNHLCLAQLRIESTTFEKVENYYHRETDSKLIPSQKINS